MADLAGEEREVLVGALELVAGGRSSARERFELLAAQAELEDVEDPIGQR